jgi:DNA topoisomerase-1
VKLVIVESPAKAKTINKYLGKDYVVESSIGHIRDLPQSAADIPDKVKDQKWTRLGVNVEEGFEPLYVVPTDKKKQIKKLKDLLKKADELYLATDEDREGEAISWHLLEVLKPKVPVKRLAFHEITKDAIVKAIDNPREVDMDLVNAQETRRVLDRLYGYEVSPILWRKIAPKLSAGRVQSVALRIIVERERARMRFVAAEYCSVVATFVTDEGEEFEATLKMVGDQKLAIGKDFDPDTGEITNKEVLRLLKKDCEDLIKKFEKSDWTIESVEKKPVKSSPYAPFITSTLQQEANRKLGMSSRDTMSAAQKLYENGYITYMRTDSISLSTQAIEAARSIIKKEYGEEYLPKEARVFKSKVKNAQEAHEAIRPAGNSFQTPDEVAGNVTPEQAKLYDLIYKRTIASQMEDARMQMTVIKIVDGNAMFQANGRVIEFPGYLKAYKEDLDKQTSGEDNILPDVSEGDKVDMKDGQIGEHMTKPPARYTEASLVKELEARGVGRPSTYASIIDTIQRRKYVYKKGKALVPTFVAFAVISLMEKHFSHLVDMEFTAELEEDLDAISRGEEDRLKYLKCFYFGDKKHTGLVDLIKADIDAREVCTIPVPRIKMDVRVGRYGPFVEKGEETASLPADVAPDELTEEMVVELLKSSAKKDEPLGVDSESGKPVFVKVGRFGPYVQLGEAGGEEKPKMKGLPPGVQVEDVDFEKAVAIVSFPKVIGKFNDEDIVADIGRYGPYVKAGSETRSLGELDILKLTEDDAVKLLKEEKKGRGRRAAKPPLKTFKEDETITVKTGRYGPYVNQGKVNVSVPKDIKPEDLTYEDAKKMIEEKKGS